MLLLWWATSRYKTSIKVIYTQHEKIQKEFVKGKLYITYIHSWDKFLSLYFELKGMLESLSSNDLILNMSNWSEVRPPFSKLNISSSQTFVCFFFFSCVMKDCLKQSWDIFLRDINLSFLICKKIPFNSIVEGISLLF